MEIPYQTIVSGGVFNIRGMLLLLNLIDIYSNQSQKPGKDSRYFMYFHDQTENVVCENCCRYGSVLPKQLLYSKSDAEGVKDS